MPPSESSERRGHTWQSSEPRIESTGAAGKLRRPCSSTVVVGIEEPRQPAEGRIGGRQDLELFAGLLNRVNCCCVLLKTLVPVSTVQKYSLTANRSCTSC